MKKVYLTIDDAPSKDFKDKVDFLYRNKICATFFCVGENIKMQQENVAYAISKGFLIGNHSYSHPHFSDLSIDEGKESILLTDQIIDETYKMAGIERPIKVFRFPYFDRGGDESGKDYENKWTRPESERNIYKRDDRRMALQSFLKELGYVLPLFEGVNLKHLSDKKMFDYVDVGCTFDQMEYFLGLDNAPYGMDKEEAILARIDDKAPYEGRALNCLDTTDIILIHDHDYTSELFYKIINKYIDKKFEFLRLFHS